MNLIAEKSCKTYTPTLEARVWDFCGGSHSEVKEHRRVLCYAHRDLRIIRVRFFGKGLPPDARTTRDLTESSAQNRPLIFWTRGHRRDAAHERNLGLITVEAASHGVVVRHF